MNESGIRPVGVRILILPESIEETDETYKAAAAAGIVLARETAQKEKMAQIKGTLVAVGPEAWKEYDAPWANIGDTVIIGKYSGLIEKGKDGKEYRIINDLDLVAVIEE